MAGSQDGALLCTILLVVATTPFHAPLTIFNEEQCETPTRFFTYALHHLYWLFPLAVLALLTAAHAQSAHMAAEISRAVTEYGEYAPAGVFDLETLRCESDRLARNMGGGGETAAAVDRLGRVCVGEEGTRWLPLAIAVVTAGLALILELDRRGARRFIATTERARAV